LQPVKVAEEAGVEEQSSESMTIESLLGMKKKDWNYYDVLGITASSTLKEIKNAYMTRAKEWHPDRNKNSKQPVNIMTYVFQLIGEAYETLSNPKTREEYDSILSHNHEKWHLRNMNPYIIVY
jgi:DnaJ-class molecular chaperone